MALECCSSTAPSLDIQRAGGRALVPQGEAVRDPLCVFQGEFGAGERVEAIYAWLTEECLADPGTGFDLSRPDRVPLPPQQSIRAAGLLPSCLLNFRGGMPGRPLLRSDVMSRARSA